MNIDPESLARLREAASSAAEAGCELFAAEPNAVLVLIAEVERLRRRCDIRDRTAAHWSEVARREVPTDKLERARNNFVECKIRQEEAPRGSIMRRVCDAAVDLVAMLDKRDDTMKARVVELGLEVERLRAENEKLRADHDSAVGEVKSLREKVATQRATLHELSAAAEKRNADLANARTDLAFANHCLDQARADLAAANDLVARLRAKCEERKAWIEQIEQNDQLEWLDCDTHRCRGCGAIIYRRSERIGQCNPGCAWQRAMEDV